MKLKTQVSAFQLHNKRTKSDQPPTFTLPKYLGITLDRSLTFKAHIEGAKLKVCARLNILRQISGTTWGSDPLTMRTTALALCYSSGEYAAPVSSRSAHSKQVNVALNETCWSHNKFHLEPHGLAG